MMRNPQSWGAFAAFDPQAGVTIREPVGEGIGYWVGAPGVFFDERDQLYYLTYRIRRPRGVEPDRGAEVQLARSQDGIEFETIWKGTKDQLGSTSIERCALRRVSEDQWLLYVSYVDPADGRWRIDVVEANGPDGFELSQGTPVLTAGDLDVEGVKDPFVFQVAGQYNMIVSIATAQQPATADDLHGTNDAYNTGLIKSSTGLATSQDGVTWQWEGEIFAPRDAGWDCYCSRIGSLWREDGLWLALYDGSADVGENYEERLGLAYSFDLRSFHRVTRDCPLIPSPYGEKTALRYFDVLALPERTLFYYEMALADGSHDLRVYALQS